MHSFGILVLLFTVVPALVAVLQYRKMKKILAAPFRKTQEVATNPQSADAKGLVSCEGAIIAPQQPLYAPVSGRPCLAYKVELRQNWHRYVKTENGMKRETGSSNITTQKVGSVFYVNDGSGPVAVDSTKGIDTDYEQSAKQVQGVAWGDVQFGNFRWSVSSPGGDKSADSVECIESVVRPDGSVFVMGKLVGGGITQEAGLFGNLLMSRKGRTALVGSTKRNATIGAVLAGLCLVSGAPMAIFGEDPPPSAHKDACEIVDESAPSEPCTGKITDDLGKTLTFTVTKPGTFEFHAKAPSTVKIPLDPVVTVKDASGNELLSHEGDERRRGRPHGRHVHREPPRQPQGCARPSFVGGFSFELTVKRTASAAEITSAAPADQRGGEACHEGRRQAPAGKTGRRSFGRSLRQTRRRSFGRSLHQARRRSLGRSLRQAGCRPFREARCRSLGRSCREEVTRPASPAMPRSIAGDVLSKAYEEPPPRISPCSTVLSRHRRRCLEASPAMLFEAPTPPHTRRGLRASRS
jgi:hypothetical protein